MLCTTPACFSTFLLIYYRPYSSNFLHTSTNQEKHLYNQISYFEDMNGVQPSLTIWKALHFVVS